MTPIKAGFLTSEFLATIASMIIGAGVLFQLVPAERSVEFTNELLQFLNICVQIATLLSGAYVTVKPLIAYIQSRLALKQTQLTTAPLPK